MKKIIIITLIALLILAVLAGGAIFVFFSGGPEVVQPSGPITAPDLEVAAAGTTNFQIVSAESEVRFKVDEVLRGEPKTVVGITNQVAGNIALDPTNPGNSQVGVIRINARTLKTDNDRRNQTINNRILQTEQFEFIEFAPTALEGFSGEVSIGETVTFQIKGDLTIRDVTKPVTFEVTATPISDTRLEANAKSTLRHKDFGLAIPNVPFVADVSDEVQLEFDFVAVMN